MQELMRAYLHWTPEEERKLREWWRNSSDLSHKNRCLMIARRLGRTDQAVFAKSKQLGLVGQQYEWTEAEIQYLKLLVANGITLQGAVNKVHNYFEKQGKKPPCRSVILRKVDELQRDCEHYQIAQLCQVLNCNQCVIRRWIEQYKSVLKPKRRGDIWFVDRKHLREFFIQYPGEVARTKPDLVWLIGILYQSKEKEK